ncbi:hypothetical protein F5Y10DRAFT_278912 [Nemania abortiva]|nr:hypothetical protein F5Y10DRAFT_278912 [Nemania abortiva]
MPLSLARSVDLSETRQPDLYASSTIPYVFSLICVLLRFWCRWVNRAGFWLDDWLILLSLAFATGLSIDLLWWIPRGLGKHVQTFGPHVQEYWAIGLFTAELTYTSVIVLVKFSILALYWRIFNKNSSIKIPIIVLTVVVSAWGIAVLLLTFLQCIPTQGLWDKTIKAACNVDSQKFLFGISIPNILVDIALLSLPIPYLIKLNVPTSQKRVLVTIFLLGGFVCIASILRLVAVATESTSPDISWDIINLAIWAVVEADFAIISACLPTMRPFWLLISRRHYTTQVSASSSSKPSSEIIQKKRIPLTWGSSLMRTTVIDEEDTKPFSSANGGTHSNFRNDLIPNPRGSQMTIGFPLSDMRDTRVPEPGVIRVQNAWNVEYN